MGGSKDATLTADVEFMDSKDRKKWTRPPISMNFEVLHTIEGRFKGMGVSKNSLLVTQRVPL